MSEVTQGHVCDLDEIAVQDLLTIGTDVRIKTKPEGLFMVGWTSQGRTRAVTAESLQEAVLMAMACATALNAKPSIDQILDREG